MVLLNRELQTERLWRKPPASDQYKHDAPASVFFLPTKDKTRWCFVLAIFWGRTTRT